MILHDIIYPENQMIDKKFINHLLKKEIFNDHYFENVYFRITVSMDHYIDFLYRILWETVYLKRDEMHLSQYNEQNQTCELCVSLSEMICFLKNAIPTNYKIPMEEALGSIQQIEDACMLLLKNQSMKSQIYFSSIFKKMLRFELFETNNTYNLERIQKLKNIVSEENRKKIMIDVQACSFPFVKHLSHLDNVDQPYQMLVIVNTHHDKQNKILLDHHVERDFVISNIYLHENEYYITLCYRQKQNAFINKLIRRVYGGA